MFNKYLVIKYFTLYIDIGMRKLTSGIGMEGMVAPIVVMNTLSKKTLLRQCVVKN